MFVRVNGTLVYTVPDAKGWISVRRLWQTGDKVRSTLPMRLEWVSMDPQKPYPGVMRIGPTLLAIGHFGTSPARHINPANLAASLLPIAGQPLHFKLASAPSLIARPFYEFTEHERYFLYLDPKYTNKLSLHDFTFSGHWFLSLSNTPGSSAEGKFIAGPEGCTLCLNYALYDDAGIAGVWLDGVKVTDIDMYSPSRGIPTRYIIENISSGTHTLRFEVLNKKNPNSRGYYVNLGNLDLLPTKSTGAGQWSLWQ